MGAVQPHALAPSASLAVACMASGTLSVGAGKPDPIFASIEAHREAWAEFSAEARWFHSKLRSRRRRRDPDEYRANRDAYEASTDALVRDAGLIASPDGLQAFTDYLASLPAYGRSDVAPGFYAVEAWHLADAVEAISAAMRRISLPCAAGLPAITGADTPRHGEVS